MNDPAWIRWIGIGAGLLGVGFTILFFVFINGYDVGQLALVVAALAIFFFWFARNCFVEGPALVGSRALKTV
jgi:hypothetical protein